MIKKPLVFCALLLTSAAFAQTDAKAIRGVFESQIVAENHSDVTAYLATIDPQRATARTQTGSILKQIFKIYKLRCQLDSFKIVSLKGNSAQAYTVISTFKVSGPKFQNNRVTATNVMIKRNGKWYLADSGQPKIENIK